MDEDDEKIKEIEKIKNLENEKKSLSVGIRYQVWYQGTWYRRVTRKFIGSRQAERGEWAPRYNVLKFSSPEGWYLVQNHSCWYLVPNSDT